MKAGSFASSAGRINRDLVASCWTWAGDAKPALADERSPIPFGERVASVAETGFSGVGLVHADVVELRDTMGLKAAHRILDDAGIGYVELEFISNWWSSGERRDFSDAIRDDLFEAAAELGATTIKVGGEIDDFLDGPAVEPELFRTEFDALATHAGSRGLRIGLEPMPMSNVRTIREGVELIASVDNKHAGLVIDIWHTARGGTDYAELAEFLPIDKVFVVEIDDADAVIVGSLWNDTLDNRLIPGDGDLRVAEFVRALHDLGWPGPWGVEMISAVYRAKPLMAALTEVRKKTMATIDVAETLLPAL